MSKTVGNVDLGKIYITRDISIKDSPLYAGVSVSRMPGTESCLRFCIKQNSLLRWVKHGIQGEIIHKMSSLMNCLRRSKWTRVSRWRVQARSRCPYRAPQEYKFRPSQKGGSNE